ncbi:MAG TPA: tRNA (N6-threonylcarbamoyladenosine(37)-N6)-methyltransferase TrmO, partial [Candidatus Wunengus sp. YC64]
MQLKSIGYIKSSIKQPKFGGWQELITEIVIDPNYIDGLEGIDEYSHLIILYWLDKVDKVKLKMRPQGKKD